MDDNWRLEYALKEHAYAIGQSVLALAKIEGTKIENLKAIDKGELQWFNIGYNINNICYTLD